MTDKTLDEIMSGREENTPENIDQATPPEVAETPAETAGRDEKGRFAPKADKADTSAEPAPEPHDDDTNAEEGKVPQQALHAARQREKEARQEVETLRTQMAQMQGQFQLVMQQIQQPPQPQQPAKPADFWEDPNKFVSEALNPIQQQMQQQREQVSRMMAEDKHGSETVQNAYQALAQALQSDPASRADYQRIMSSPHPYGELVAWHQRRQVLEEIGSDPNAYKERLRQELLSEIQQQSAPTPSQQPPAARGPMPSNFATARSEGPRAGVVHSGPKPLSEITKGPAQ